MNGNGNGKWQTFLQFNVGHLLIIISMLGTAFWWFVTYDREFTVAKLTIGQQGELGRALTIRVDNIDNNGTRYSQKNIDKEFELYKNSVERITRLEQANSALLPKVDQLVFRMQSVFDYIEEQKKKNP